MKKINSLDVSKMLSELLLREVQRELASIGRKVTAWDVDRFIAGNITIYSADIILAETTGDKIYLIEAKASLGKVIGAIIQKIKIKHCE